MSKRSVFYKYPLFYIWGLKWVHKANFTKRYRYMASFVKKGNTVLEPACGPAILADFLPEGVYYRGFDTNKKFINFALKKHAGVYLGNVLDTKNYTQADVIIACDILHHLKPIDRKKFIKNCLSSNSKILIICEPGTDNSWQERFFYPIYKLWFEYMEQDGTNKPKVIDQWTKKELDFQMEHGFEVIPNLVRRKIEEIGDDFIGVYFLKEK